MQLLVYEDDKDTVARALSALEKAFLHLKRAEEEICLMIKESKYMRVCGSDTTHY